MNLLAATDWGWLNKELIAGNNAGHILAFFAAVCVAWFIGVLLRGSLLGIAKRIPEERELNAALVRALARSVVLIALVIGVHIGTVFIVLGPSGGSVENFVNTTVGILFTVAVAWGCFHIVEVPTVFLARIAEKSKSKLDDMLVPVVRKSLRLTIVVFAGVNIAQILSDKPISSIIAGLGIGGLAVALAAQDTLKNFFGSVVIFTDKPFELGERINFDGHDGIIEEVGMRSTRLRRLDGHLVTIPNAELANKAIHNISHRPNIRRIINIGITYDTPPEKVKEAKAILEDILKDHEGLDPKGELLPRVYFNDMKADSLNLFAIYWYHPPAWWDYCAHAERVNLEILERFNKAGIDFAFPTQTLHVAGDAKHPLEIRTQ